MSDTIAVTVTVDIVDQHLLRAYTSGFMPDTATSGERVTAILIHGGHPIHPEINGIGVVDASYEDTP